MKALITGASSGIGRDIARELSKRGYDLIISARREDRLLALREEIKTDVRIITADLSGREECMRLYEEARGEDIDILVNNAGITRDGLAMAMKEEDFDDVIATNLKGTFNCIRFASRIMMKQRYGKIINMSSVSGITGNAGQVNYSAAKAGVIGITKSMARELAGRHINVNAIAPGFIETDMTNELSEKVKEQAVGQIPLGRFGKAEEVAELAAFLAGNQSDYITGQVFHIDGGMVM